MPRRRDALTKIDATLKNMVKKIPESTELARILTGLAHGCDPDYRPAALDRTAAIAAAALLEHALEIAIVRRLKPGLSDRERKDLFDGATGGPLGSFHAKTIMAFAMGLVDQQQREDLDTIRIVRNAFAHSVGDIEFTNAEITGECNTLHITVKPPGSLSPKFIFIVIVAALFNQLMWYPLTSVRTEPAGRS